MIYFILWMVLKSTFRITLLGNQLVGHFTVEPLDNRHDWDKHLFIIQVSEILLQTAP